MLGLVAGLSGGCAANQANCHAKKLQAEVYDCSRDCPAPREVRACEPSLTTVAADELLQSPERYLGKRLAVRFRPEVKAAPLQHDFPGICGGIAVCRDMTYRAYHLVGVFGSKSTFKVPSSCRSRWIRNTGGTLTCCDVNLNEDLVVEGVFDRHAGVFFRGWLINQEATDDADRARFENMYEIREEPGVDHFCRP
jgi:hypothetical protein